jgi:protein-L-isoaspartate O-methyltransferase
VADVVDPRLRASFDEDAERYDRARPGYPPRLFEDLIELAGLGPGCRLLEVGAGTGKASVPLAVIGCRITAVELGRIRRGPTIGGAPIRRRPPVAGR